MKPIIIIPPDLMKEAEIQLLRENGLCVVVATDPTKVKFVDPIPAMSSRTQIEDAAIRLSRMLIHGQWGNYSNTTYVGQSEISRMYVDCLVSGTPLDRNGPEEEQRSLIHNQAKRAEIERLAREEARAERAAAKATKGK